MKHLLTLALLWVPTLESQAAVYTNVLSDKSTIRFISKQMNVPVEGDFKKFAARVVFDTAKPESGRAEIELEPGSIDTGFSEGNETVQDKDWFNVKTFPKSRFVASSVKSLGKGQYQAMGKLTLKDKTRDVVVPFTVKPQGDTLVLDGTFELKRLDYGIGSGLWGDTAVVANEVQIKFHFTLGTQK